MIGRALILYFFSLSTFACPNALPTDDVNFCPSFKSAARCYCAASGVPAGMCDDIHILYRRMVAIFRTLQRVCEHQRNTSTQNCLDDWNCYLYGNVDSQGRLCSSTGKACD